MPNENNAIAIYSSSINTKQKQLLLDAYRDYTSFARSFEQMIQMHSTIYLANYQLEAIRSEDDDLLPWELEILSNTKEQAFANFVNKENASSPKEDDYSYVSLTKTNPYIQDKYPSIISVPNTHGMHCHVNSLPHSIERYVVAYPINTLLKDTTFIIDGVRSIKYIGKKGDMLVSDALEDKNFCRSMYCMLNILAELPYTSKIEQNKEFERANKEGLLRELMSPYENILLSTLSTLTDETHNIVREILQKKHPDNYLNKAEDLGFIKSSLEFQDLLNIRHLLHHQFETLDGYGRFINGENNQNKSIRTRYMESYQRLCEGTFYERVARYIKTANGFKPLVETLVPNIFIRAKEESNNKFIQRVKEYASTHKNQTIYIDTTYPFKEKKKEALIKALKKLVPNVEIIDNIEEGNIDAFSVRIDNYLDRCKYLELFQVIEHRIGEYCLFEGDKCPPHQGWARLANKRILTPQEAEKWNQYKTLRNDLSHKYLSDDLLEKLRETLPLLVEETINLSSRLDELKPEVTVGENNIFTITHKDGRIIEVDFENKEILSIKDNNGNKLKTKRVSIPRGRFTEEYPNGTKISLKGAEIQAITLPKGSTIDVQKGRLYISDDTKFFIDNDKCYLVTPNAKLILDTDFKLISYIEKQRRINVGNNEIIKPSPNHTIIIDEKGYFKSIEYGNGKKYAHVTLKKQKNGFLASFSDGTKWSKTDTDSIITHNNIELTYENRKKFIESYDDGKDPHIRSINLSYNR